MQFANDFSDINFQPFDLSFKCGFSGGIVVGVARRKRTGFEVEGVDVFDVLMNIISAEVGGIANISAIDRSFEIAFLHLFIHHCGETFEQLVADFSDVFCGVAGVAGDRFVGFAIIHSLKH